MPKPAMLRKEEVGEEVTMTKKELVRWATDNMRLFFSDKKFFCGGPIPECELLTKKNVEAVINVSFEWGFRYAYYFLFPCLRVERDQIWRKDIYHGPDFQISYALRLLRDMRRKNIPKLFHPGLMLLYFKLCKGCKVEVPARQVRFPL